MYSEKRDQPTVAPLKPKLLEKLLAWAAPHIPLKALMIPLKHVKLRGVV